MSNTIPNTPSETITLADAEAHQVADDSPDPQSDKKNKKNSNLPDSLERRMATRLAVIEALLSEKENLMIEGIQLKIPKAFYNKWKNESKLLVFLYVKLKHRLKKLEINKKG